MRDMEDDIDIYEDLPSFEAKVKESLTSTVEEKSLEQEHKELKEQVIELTAELENCRKAKENLQVNLSSLLKTAKAEIARKDRTIDELRKELDNISFRRGFYAKSTQKREAHHKQPYEQSTHAKPDHQPVHAQLAQRSSPVPAYHASFTYEPPFVQDNSNMMKSESYYDDEEEAHYYESQIDEEPQKPHINRACSTVFGQRLLKRLEQENLERKQKNAVKPNENSKSKDSTLIVPIPENDKENDSLCNLEAKEKSTYSPIREPDAKHKLLPNKAENPLKPNKSDIPPPTKYSTKRPSEEVKDEKNAKRLKIENHKRNTKLKEESMSNYDSEKYDGTESDHRHHPPAAKSSRGSAEWSTVEHPVSSDERDKYRGFDVPARNSDKRGDFTTESPYHKRFVDGYQKRGKYADKARISRDDIIANRAFNERPNRKKRNDYRYDIDYNDRYKNKYKEDYYDKIREDRHTQKKPSSAERYKDDKHRRNHTGRGSKRQDDRYFDEDKDRYARKDVYHSREHSRNTPGRYSAERRGSSVEENIYNEQKRKRRKSNPAKSVERERKMSEIVEEVKLEVVEKKVGPSDLRRSKSLDRPSEELMETVKDDKDECATKLQKNANDRISVKDETEDTCLEEGELPSTPDRLSAKPKTDVRSVKKEDLCEETETSPEHTHQPSLVLGPVKIDEVVKTCLRDLAPNIIQSPDDPPVQNSEPANHRDPECTEVSVDNARLASDAIIPSKIRRLPENDNDVIDIFGSTKECEVLTSEVHREESDSKKPESPPQEQTQHGEHPSEVTNNASALQTNPESTPNFNDSIEKKLERMENSITEEDNLSRFFMNFRSSNGLETEPIESKMGERPEVNVQEECHSEGAENLIVQSECIDSERTKLSVSSISSSSSFSSTSSSTLSSSEEDEVEKKEAEKEQSITKTVSEPVAEPDTHILPETLYDLETMKSTDEELVKVSEFSDSKNEAKKSLSEITDHSPEVATSKSGRKVDVVKVTSSAKLNGKVVVFVRRRNPVRLSNNNAGVTVIIDSKNPSSCVTISNSSTENSTTSKPRACKNSRFTKTI